MNYDDEKHAEAVREKYGPHLNGIGGTHERRRNLMGVFENVPVAAVDMRDALKLAGLKADLAELLCDMADLLLTVRDYPDGITEWELKAVGAVRKIARQAAYYEHCKAMVESGKPIQEESL